ncbi:MAG: hypothetical protein JSW03_09130 [Candidatus Eiseniibacteriota bacterium]|nr:MAG: hypothetical protein JSW03_09130 [Candidatus Eisenbacteria bacterium]
MKPGQIGLILLLALLGALLVSCEKQLEAPSFENPLDPGYTGPQLPATPVITTANVGNRLVMLTWTVTDTTGIGSYRVYRSSGSTVGYSLKGSTVGLAYSDETVSNGVRYLYRVCAVTRDGREGKRSEAVECTPAPFSVTIDGGKRYATSRTVSLSFSAPPGTHSVLPSNDLSFSGATWRSYASSLSWVLEAGDGQKTVWVRFRDQYGLESVAVGDSILLDTRAFINSVGWTPGDSVLSPGSSIKLILAAGEVGGEAWVDIGDVVNDIHLFDDGTHGDASASDGSYEVSFSLPPGEEFYRETVMGHFEDEAGNFATPVAATRQMTVAAAPEAVVLISLNARNDGSGPYVELTWSQNNEADFGSYRIYRDPSAVTPASLMVGSVSTRSQTFFADTTVASSAVYRYRVYVVDALGLSTGSNEKTVSVP